MVCESCKTVNSSALLTIGRTWTPVNSHKLGYIVLECKYCKRKAIYDEAGELYDYNGEVYPLH